MNPIPDPTTTAAGGRPYSAPRSEMWAWGFGALASHLLIQTYAQANLIFTVGFGLSPVLISWCMMLPRVINGFLDPLLGHWSDNTHTRWGRRKPFILVSSIVGAFFLAAVWWADPEWSSAGQFVYLLVFGVIFYIAYGIYTMAWTALGFELTDDYAERSKVQAIATFFLVIVSMTAGWMYWLALRPAFGGEIWGMRWISAIVAVVIIASGLVVTLFCRERFTHVNAPRERVAILQAIRTTMKNRPFVILVLLRFCQTTAERVGGGLLVFLSIYYICQGNKDLATKIAGIGATIGTIWTFALLPFMKPITLKIGKKGALVAGALVSTAFVLVQPFTLTPQYPYLLLLPFLLVLPIMTISGTIGNAIVPDICDLDELQTGERREGLFTAVLGFVAKLQISLSFLVVGYLLVWTGVDTKVTAQPASALNALFWITIAPNIVFTILSLLLALKFPLTEGDMVEVRRQLDERRLAKAALGEPTDEVAEEFAHEHPREAVEFVAQHPQIVAEVEEEERMRGMQNPGEDKSS